MATYCKIWQHHLQLTEKANFQIELHIKQKTYFTISDPLIKKMNKKIVFKNKEIKTSLISVYFIKFHLKIVSIRK